MFWNRKRSAAADPETVVVPAPVDPTAWLPEDAYEPQSETFKLLRGPFRMDEESAIMDAYISHVNDLLRQYGIHADQVDGGLVVSRIPINQRTSDNQYNVHLEQVINGLGIRYITDTYPHAGFCRDAGGVVRPWFDTVRERHAASERSAFYDLYAGYYYHRHTVFHISTMNDLITGIPKYLDSLGEELTKERIPVNPTTLMGKLVLRTFHVTRLAPDIITGVLLPERASVSGSGTHKRESASPYVPQLYHEYLRSGMPISFLLAAVLPVYHAPESSRWHPSASKTEYTPRFNLMEVYPLREAPIGLSLEMVGASRSHLMASVNERF